MKWQDIWDKAVKAAAAAGGAVAGLFGGVDTVLKVLLAMMVIDYITGLVVAWMGRSGKTETGLLDSKAGARGIAKKVLMLLLVVVAAMVDRALGGERAVFRDMVIWFYLANEGLSILENLALAGVPFPQGVKKALEQVKQQHDEREREREQFMLPEEYIGEIPPEGEDDGGGDEDEGNG